MNLQTRSLAQLQKIAQTFSRLADAREKEALEAQQKKVERQIQTQTTELARLETEIDAFEVLLQRVQNSQLRGLL